MTTIKFEVDGELTALAIGQIYDAVNRIIKLDGCKIKTYDLEREKKCTVVQDS